MTKSEFIQVMVRLVGVIMIGYAGWSVIGLISSSIAITTVGSIGSSGPGSGIIATFLLSVVSVAALFFVGLYLVKDGSLMIDLLEG